MEVTKLNKDTEHKELMRFMEWTINNEEKWEGIVSLEEMESVQLLATLKSLHESGFHAMYLTVLKKNEYTMPLSRILKNILWEQIANILDYEKVQNTESRIITELELVHSNRDISV
jgi:antirestriction protein